MAIKFPLKMKDDVQVRNISDLREHFDIESVVGYFFDGKLLTWLSARYYEEEEEAVAKLDKDDLQLAEKLCDILGVEYKKVAINAEEIARRNERIAVLKQYTNDEDIIKDVDCVAFNQEELVNLYERDKKKIYLCAGEFNIPKEQQKLEYIELGGAIVKGKRKVRNVDRRFEVRTKFILDPQCSSGIRTNNNGIRYNREINYIFLLDIEFGEEEIIAENVLKWISNKTKIFYVIYDTEIQHFKIIMYDMNEGTTEFVICIDDFWRFMCIDENKVIWEEKGGLQYVKYFSDDNRKLIFAPRRNQGGYHVREGHMYNDLYLYRPHWGGLCYKNLLDGVEKGIHGQISDTPLKINDKFLWFAGKWGREIYRFNLIDLSLESIYSTEGARGIHLLEVLENEIIWIGEYELGEYKLYILNRKNNQKKILDVWRGDIGDVRAYLYIEFDWIYYSYMQSAIKGQFITRKIRFDGTEKTELFNRQEVINRVLEKQGLLVPKIIE